MTDKAAFPVLSARGHRELMAARDFILHALSSQMCLRPDTRNWIEAERLAVALAANQWSIAHGLRQVTVADVERIETSAVGHVDYATKLALYVAEALYGLHPTERGITEGPL